MIFFLAGPAQRIGSCTARQSSHLGSLSLRAGIAEEDLRGRSRARFLSFSATLDRRIVALGAEQIAVGELGICALLAGPPPSCL